MGLSCVGRGRHARHWSNFNSTVTNMTHLFNHQDSWMCHLAWIMHAYYVSRMVSLYTLLQMIPAIIALFSSHICDCHNMLSVPTSFTHLCIVIEIVNCSTTVTLCHCQSISVSFPVRFDLLDSGVHHINASVGDTSPNGRFPCGYTLTSLSSARSSWERSIFCGPKLLYNIETFLCVEIIRNFLRIWASICRACAPLFLFSVFPNLFGICSNSKLPKRCLQMMQSRTNHRSSQSERCSSSSTPCITHHHRQLANVAWSVICT